MSLSGLVLGVINIAIVDFDFRMAELGSQQGLQEQRR
jgi:hypothetical protein